MKEFVTIPKDVYDALIGFAEAELEDIESGIEEGIYEDSPDNSTRQLELEDLINTIPIHPEVYVYLEGGNIQGASATIGMGFQVFDKDNFDAEEEEDFAGKYAQYNKDSLDDWNKFIEEETQKGNLRAIY